MAKAKGGLGRGLDALIPPADGEQPRVQQVAIAAIIPNPYQPRHALTGPALQELAESIRVHGVIQPLLVAPSGETGEDGSPRYQLIAGERRWRAAQLAGLTSVPVVVREATRQDLLEWALVENLQREDLNPLEAAAGYRRLMDEFNLTQEGVAARVGKHRVTIANAVRLLHLPARVQEALMAGEITEGHGRALLALEDEALAVKAMEIVISKGLPVRATEELVRRLRQGGITPEAAARLVPVRDVQTEALEREFIEALGTKVELRRTKKGGSLIIYFYSEEELDGLYQLIVRQQRPL